MGAGAGAGATTTGAGAGATTTGAGAGAGAGATTTGAGAGAGAGAAATTIAPSQPGAAVAGVQLALRQHRPDALPIFHCKLPWPLRQLSLLVVEPFAKAEPATATVAKSIATLFNLII